MLTLALRNTHPLVKDGMLVLLASIVMSLSGLLSFTIPFTVVPLTFQVSVVLFVCALLGAKRGFCAVALFLCEGMSGLPVFSKGYSGIAWMFGPTGGYLLGYLIGGTATGFVAEKFSGKNGMLLALTVGNLIVYCLGAAWLSHFVGGIKAALIAGVLPFIIGDLCKNLMFTQLGRRRLPFSL